MSYTREFPGWADQIRQARTWADRVMATHTGYAIPDDTAAAAVLCLSEAATNALRYTASGRGGVFKVTIKLDRRRVTIEVDDEGRPAGGTIPFVRPITPMAQHGRGMALIDHYTHTWGPLPRPRTGVTFTLTWQDTRARKTAPAPPAAP
ncbi:ATP-binding protein [Nocardiopsis mangrovi]|uniref:ATP-binding protein n=1 Tax=Nocardiopsis mangrovi TaxID=1179818 RepID=A0ABV9DP81_9ACTN